MEFGDKLYAGFDEMNMKTADNQLSSLYSFVGTGVYSGWDITTMYSEDPTLAIQLQKEKNFLATAEDGSDLNRQYLALGSPNVGLDNFGVPYDIDVWKQTVRVTPGEGIVGLYRARTINTFYFLLSEGLYDIWAEPSLCLTTEGLAVITVKSINEDVDGDGESFAYLGQVEVINQGASDYIFSIDYTDRRQDLKNLAGAFQQALQQSFYKHVHVGGVDNPSKILLDTELILNAPIPSDLKGSTVFIVKKSDGATFTWDNSDYGAPKVLLNNIVLPSSEYELSPRSGKIYLKNSLSTGSKLQLVLPLSPQIVLSAVDINTGGIIKLTDKQSMTTVYTWDYNSYDTPQVYLKNILQDPSIYEITPSLGQIKFYAGLSNVTYQNEDLLVLLTALGKEVEGTLSGKRLKNVDASSFVKGTLASNRIPKIDHVGQIRLKEPMSLNPHLRLLDDGDHITYCPEIADNLTQYNTKIETVYYSQIFGCYLIGTKHGLMQTSDFVNISPISAWTPDMGIPVKIVDNTLNGEVYFRETCVLTKEGTIYFSKDMGATWSPLKLPKIAETSTKIITPKITDFWVSTDRVEVEKKGFKTYAWYTIYYIGTLSNGAFSARIAENQTDSEWQWSVIRFPSGNINTTIYSIAEICSLYSVIAKDGSNNSFERSVYIGTNDGFLVSLKGSSYKLFSNDAIKKIQGLKQSEAINNILWRSDTELFISHESEKYVVTDDVAETTTTYYGHPLEKMMLELESFAVVATATTPSNNISAIIYDATLKRLTTNLIVSINGVSLVNQRVLFTHFTGENSKYNGIYTYNGDDNINSFWLRASDMNTSASVSTRKYIGCLDESVWMLKNDNNTLDVSSLNFEQLVDKLIELQNTEVFVGDLLENPQYYQYWALTNKTAYSITDRKIGMSNWYAPEIAQITWSISDNGIPRASCLVTDGVIVGSERGLWKTINNGITWFRVFNVITTGVGISNPAIYNVLTNEEIAEYGNWIFDQNTQNFTFNIARNAWDNFVYEKDYLTYYTTPWDASADVVAYENIDVVQDSYVMIPEEGKITFNSARNKDSIIKITIVRQGAFVSNVGNTPHTTLPNVLVVEDAPITTLSAPLTPETQIVSVAHRELIPDTIEYLELKFGSFKERVSVYVDKTTDSIVLAKPRMSTTTFPIDETEVFIAELQTVVGIEDKISMMKSNQPYNLNSLAGANLIQVSIAAKVKYPTLFTDYIKEDNALFATNSDMDSTASSSSLYLGVEPSLSDSPVQPHVMYALFAPSVTGDNLRVATDQGMWVYDISKAKWINENGLGNASKAYFIKEIDGCLTAGTDTGFWERKTNFWALNAIYPQSVYDYIKTGWGDNTCEVFAKNDGLSFVKISSSGFVSNSFSPLDERNVYGLFKGQFITTDENGERKNHDAMYLCTEIGLFAVTDCATAPNSYNDFIDGREMFGASQLTKTAVLPNGDIVVVPVKMYKIFQSPRPKSFIFHILTNNGVYRVRNWRWCNPLEKTGGTDFIPEAHYLPNISCYCYTTVIANENNITKYKMFVGSNKGVYRSYDEGFTWERCERINRNDVSVFDIQTYEAEISSGVFKTCLMAATEKGIVTSMDDGDTWLLPGVNNPIATFNHSVSNTVRFERGVPDDPLKLSYLTQGFKNSTGSRIDINKISVYVGKTDYKENDVSFTQYTFDTDPTLQVDIN